MVGVREQGAYLIANNYYAGGARKQTPFELIEFEIFGVFEPFQKQNKQENFREAVQKAFRIAGLGKGKTRLAVEPRTLPLEAGALNYGKIS